MSRILNKIFRLFLTLPVFNNFSNTWYRKLGVIFYGNAHISPMEFIGDYHHLILSNNADINRGCFLVAKDDIIIGENSTLAYGVTVLTSANPNGPYNELSKLYPSTTAPVKIGKNVWVGANATILPGVEIGDFCVVAAGAVVTKNVPPNSLVAGVPACIKKQLWN